MNSKQRRLGGGRLACSFCGVKASKDEVAAGPGVYICHGCVANARSEGRVEATGDRCSFCTRGGRPNWSLGAPGQGLPRICDVCLDLGEKVLADQGW